MGKTSFINRFHGVRHYNKGSVAIDKTVLFKAFSCHTITIHPHESLKRKQGLENKLPTVYRNENSSATFEKHSEQVGNIHKYVRLLESRITFVEVL